MKMLFLIYKLMINPLISRCGTPLPAILKPKSSKEFNIKFKKSQSMHWIHDANIRKVTKRVLNQLLNGRQGVRKCRRKKKKKQRNLIQLIYLLY